MKKNWIIALLLLIVLLATVAISYSFGKKTSAPKVFQGEQKSLVAIIKAIDGNRLTVLADNRDLEGKLLEELKNRIVHVDSSTVIKTIGRAKTQKEVDEELKQFDKNFDNATTEEETKEILSKLSVPKPYIEKNLSLSDLRINQWIHITTTTDIRYQKEFIARTIEVTSDGN